MTQEERAKLLEICNKATLGPWEATNIGVNDSDGDVICEALWAADIKFISAARTAFPAVLKELDSSMQRESEKDAEIAALKQQLAGVMRERDAAIRDIVFVHGDDCSACKHKRSQGCVERLKMVSMDECFEWRGLCAENAPDGAESEE